MRAIIRNDTTKEERLLSDGLKIGRNEACDIVVNDSSASREHAVFRTDGSAWYVVDNDSTNGTFLNGEKILVGIKRVIDNGDTLRIGNVDFTVRIMPEEAVRTTAFTDFEGTMELTGAPTYMRDVRAETRREEQVREHKPQKKKRSAAKTALIIGGCVLLLAAAVVGWCGAWKAEGDKRLRNSNLPDARAAYEKDFLFGGNKTAAAIRKAEKAYHGGDYAAAAEYYDQFGEYGAERKTECIRRLALEAYDRGDYRSAAEYSEQIGEVGQELWTNSMLGLGEEAFSEKEYQKAAAYFEKAGEKGEKQWADAVYAEGMRLLAEGDAEGAIAYLQQIGDREDAKRQIGAAQMMLAQTLYERGDYERAISEVEAIEDRSLIETAAFLNDAYYRYGMQLFGQGQFEKALDAFRKCSDHAFAEANAEILEQILVHNDLYEATRLVLAYTDAAKTEIPLETWKSVIIPRLDAFSAVELNGNLKTGCIKALLNQTSELSRELLEQSVPQGEFVGSFEATTEDYFVLKSLDGLYDGAYGSLGTQPAGKALIVVCKAIGSWELQDKARPYSVALGLMNCLPVDLIPASLEEVEYIVLLTYGQTAEGYYDWAYGIRALREDGKVEVLHLPDGEKVFQSETVSGEKPPASISYNMFDAPKYRSGGAPNMGEELFNALSAIRK